MRNTQTSFVAIASGKGVAPPEAVVVAIRQREEQKAGQSEGNVMGDEPNDEAKAEPSKKRKRLTDAQRIARHQQQIASIKKAAAERTRTERNHLLIVIGGAVIKVVREHPESREMLVSLLKANVVKPSDLEAIEAWLSDT